MREGSTRPSNRKTRIATQILEDILPHTGVYKDVLVLVLDTLKQAIYSSTLTSTSVTQDKEGHSPSYLPYFEMVFRLEEERNTAAETLKDESEQLRSEVSKTRSESENIAALLDKKTRKIDDLKNEIKRLSMEHEEKDDLVGKLQRNVQVLSENVDEANQEKVLQKKMFESWVVKKDAEILKVSTFKREYYNLQTDFFRLSEQNSDEDENGKVDEKRSESVVLQEQLVGIINNLLQEQDNFRARYNNLVLNSSKSDDLSDWNKRYIIMRETFTKLGMSVLNELKLLNTHINYERKLAGLEAEEEEEEEIEVNVRNLFAEGKDPFHSKEIITAKYAASVEISTNDCITFSRLSGSKECKSCDAVVFICPHLHFAQNSVIKLPPGCSHLKVSRPFLNVPPADCLREALAEEENSQGSNTRLDQAEESGEQRSSRGVSRGVSNMSRDTVSTRDLNKKLAKMWRNCSRTYFHRSRELSEEHVITCIEHFFLYLSNIGKEDLYKSMVDHLADFLLGQYQLEELMAIVRVDLLSAIAKYAPDNPFIAIFGCILSGSLDPIMFRYIYLLNDILLSLDLVCTLDLRPLMMVLYPHLTDEDIDPHVLSFSSHSNNRISPSLVSNYLMHCIVRDREPRVCETVIKLKQNCGASPSRMSYPEFNCAMESVYPLATNKSKEHYFACSLSNNNSKMFVETSLLGQVVAFIQLQEAYPKIISEINDKIHHYRTKIPAEMIEAGLRQKQSLDFVCIPSNEQAKKQLIAINKAAKSLELLHNNPCWREDIDIAPQYLDLTRPLL
ncbi:uncharacterized protein LOC134821326 isoform X2 [Bolinopsis microptera]|uniref:uncharacterized protein LOC134821326 isoform X2 n=1 Tax=Bolinopsis microptera TaxID=2820187 RepID=UPI00307A68EE